MMKIFFLLLCMLFATQGKTAYPSNLDDCSLEELNKICVHTLKMGQNADWIPLDFCGSLINNPNVDPVDKRKTLLLAVTDLATQAQSNMLCTDERAIIDHARGIILRMLLQNFQDTFTDEQKHILSASNILTAESSKTLYDHLQEWGFGWEDMSVGGILGIGARDRR